MKVSYKVLDWKFIIKESPLHFKDETSRIHHLYTTSGLVLNGIPTEFVFLEYGAFNMMKVLNIHSYQLIARELEGSAKIRYRGILEKYETGTTHIKAMAALGYRLIDCYVFEDLTLV